MARQIDSPFPIFTDVDGSPLEGGYIFIGEPNLDPLTNPKQAYWDEDLTEPADNIRTKSGYPVNGTFPSRLFIPDGDYSILIQNKREITVYSSVTAPELGVNVTTGAQTFFGVKTFDSIPIVPSNPIESGDTGAVQGGDVYTYVTDYVPTYVEGYSVPIEVAQILSFATQKDRSARNLEPFDLNNAVSTTGDYATLWAEIGHLYNDLHVLAGDSDLSGSSTLFYPTPPPTEEGWLTVWEGTPTDEVVYPHNKGKYRLTVTGFDGSSSGSTCEIDLDPSLAQAAYLVNFFVNVVSGANSFLQYTVAFTKFSIIGQGGYSGDGLITKIERWEPETLSTEGAYKYVQY